MRTKSWKCEICHGNISELGAYAKLSALKYAHLTCYTANIAEIAHAQGRDQVLQKQAEEARKRAEQEQREREERYAREKAIAEQQAQVAERERTNRILAAKANPLPPRVDILKPPDSKPEAKKDEKPEEKKDRFELLEIE